MGRRKNKNCAVPRVKYFDGVKKAEKKYAGSSSAVHDDVQTMDIDKRVNKDFTRSTNAVTTNNPPPSPPPCFDMQACGINNLYAAVKFYVGNSSVKSVPVGEILEFNKSRTKFPYNAYVETGKLDENNEKVYEPAAILAVSYNREQLDHPPKRYSKPNKRRSDVIHDLAIPKKQKKLSSSKQKNNKLKEVQNPNQPKQQLKGNNVDGEDVSLAEVKMQNYTNNMKTSLDLELKLQVKDELIMQLKRQLDALKTLEPVHFSNEPKGSFSVSKSHDQLSSYPSTPKLPKGVDKSRASLNLYEHEFNLASVNDSPLETPVIRPRPNSYSSASSKALHSRRLSKKLCSSQLHQKAPTPEKTPIISPRLNSCSSASSKASHSRGSSKKLCSSQLRQKAPTPEKTPIISPRLNSYSSAFSKASTVGHKKGLSEKSCSMPLRQKATENGYRGSLKKVSDSRDTGKLKNRALRARLNAEVFNYIASTDSDNISLPNSRTEEFHNDHNLDNSENENTSNVVRENSYTSKVNNGCKVFDVIKMLEKQPANKRYVKKVNIVEYDTDNYNDEPGQKMSPFKKWTEETIDTETGDTKKKHMFHIHYGISVPYKNWKKALAAKSDYGFLRELINYIWDPQIFLTKSIQPKRTADKESREKVTPKKKKP